MFYCKMVKRKWFILFLYYLLFIRWTKEFGKHSLPSEKWLIKSMSIWYQFDVISMIWRRFDVNLISIDRSFLTGSSSFENVIRQKKGNYGVFLSIMNVHTHIYITLHPQIYVQKPTNCNEAVTIIIITIMMLHNYTEDTAK